MNIWTNLLNNLGGAFGQQPVSYNSAYPYNYNTAANFSQFFQPPVNQPTTYLPYQQNSLASFFGNQNSDWANLFANLFYRYRMPPVTTWPPIGGSQAGAQMWSDLQRVTGKGDNFAQQDFTTLITQSIGAANVNNQAAIQNYLNAHPFLGLTMADISTQLEAISVSGGAAGTRSLNFVDKLAMAIMQKADKAYVPVSGGLAKDGLISRTEFFTTFPAGGVGTQPLPIELINGISIQSPQTLDGEMARLGYVKDNHSIQRTNPLIGMPDTAQIVYSKNGRSFMAQASPMQTMVWPPRTSYTFTEVTSADTTAGNDNTGLGLAGHRFYTVPARADDAHSILTNADFTPIPRDPRMIYIRAPDPVYQHADGRRITLTVDRTINSYGIVTSANLMPSSTGSTPDLSKIHATQQQALAYLQSLGNVTSRQIPQSGNQPWSYYSVPTLTLYTLNGVDYTITSANILAYNVQGNLGFTIQRYAGGTTGIGAIAPQLGPLTATRDPITGQIIIGHGTA